MEIDHSCLYPWRFWSLPIIGQCIKFQPDKSILVQTAKKSHRLSERERLSASWKPNWGPCNSIVLWCLRGFSWMPQFSPYDAEIRNSLVYLPVVAFPVWDFNGSAENIHSNSTFPVRNFYFVQLSGIVNPYNYNQEIELHK